MTTIRLFLVGDVMLGRGIDMILPYHNDPVLYEDNGLNAFDYVKLAIQQNGPIPCGRAIDYVWGDAIEILKEKKPDIRIINLETSITTHNVPWPMKGIHYRMHPENVNVIAAAKIDCCILANNHVADWGFEGLNSTVKTLTDANIKYAGTGHEVLQAQAPAIFNIQGKGRVLVFSGGHSSSGIPDEWKPSGSHGNSGSHGGVNMIDILNPKKAVQELKKLVSSFMKPNDIVVLSLHWGGNWGFDISSSFKKFAHAAIDKAGIDIIHGHSSHHVKGVEVYNSKLIIYGCGDFLNDYEGISGHKEYRDDLSLMYFVDIDFTNGKMVHLSMVPTQIKNLRVNRAPKEGIEWLYNTMKRECKKLGLHIVLENNELHAINIL